MILLTGATGLAGSFVAQEFVRTQQRVRILVRNRAKVVHLASTPTVDIVEGDMSEKGSLRAALEGVARVLMISGPDPQMVEKQCTFVDGCKEAGVRHVIKFSGLDRAEPGSIVALVGVLVSSPYPLGRILLILLGV